ncbi:MAG TPA: transcription termination/antitermination protein NusG [Kiritimatiellia bacterium]|nr:transcription termination/antitermination protein NusG [Kiritimatiellia bacterium]HRU70826.1 transcription termination/antitermination protein NusG [Kiritimatiellia bacterium]
MTKQWFVLHTLTGQEQKVKRSIEARVRIEEMGEFIGEVVIPTEKVSEVKNGVKTTVTRKFFPGYVLINLALYDENRNVLEPTWRFLKETAGVIGFLGGERPLPLPANEVDAIVNQVADKGKEKAKPKVQFEPGETVKIIDGPFMSFNGTVDEVDPDRGKLKVSVAIFGRSAPVELEYWQVERAVNENA